MSEPTYVDGPFRDPELARAARVAYAELLTRRGLSARYGVKVSAVPGSRPPVLAVYVVERSDLHEETR